METIGKKTILLKTFQMRLIYHITTAFVITTMQRSQNIRTIPYLLILGSTIILKL